MDIPQGYKQTELGIIPEDWEVKSFSQVFDMYPNNTYPRDCMNDSYGAIRNIHYGDVLIKYPTIVDVERCSIPYLNEDVKIKAQKFVQSGDVIIADTAEDETVGKCVEIKNAINAKIVSGLHTFFCHPIRIFAIGWWGDYLNSSNYHNQLLPYITGIKVSSISRASIQETKLLVPPIAEQKAIAEALSDIDGLIAVLDKKIAKKRLIKQGAMQQLLTGKKRLPGFSDPWVEKRLGDMGHLMNGYTFKSETYNLAGEFKIITIANVQSGYLMINACNRIIELPVDIQPHQMLKKGDILISMTGNVGRTCVVNQTKCLLNQRVGKFDIDKDFISSQFLFELLKNEHFENAMIDAGQGAAQANIGKNDIENYKCYVPRNKAEQKAIATILNDMDKEIDDLEAQRDKYRLLKSGMMQKLLTGQIRLKIK